jgi:hypothetical protein
MARDGSFVASRYRMMDVGTDEYLDVYSFPPDDAAPAAPTVFEDSKSTLEYAVRELGVDGQHFVNSGLIQDEYRDSRQGVLRKE